MKATELMIGDWVKFPIGNEKIVDLPYIEGKGLCASFAASVTLFPIEVDNLEPIPLTPEIMERNGMKPFKVDKFKDVATGKWWSKGGDFYVKQYHFKHRNFQPIYSFGCQSHTLIEGIQFVHELQHALRLCHINKEIVI